jgi:hypothetical protein
MRFVQLALILMVISHNAYAKKGSFYIVMTSDWEGRELLEENIKVVKDFRAQFPHMPILHFLNPAYFTKPDARPNDIIEKTEKLMKKGDERGLHIHAWKSLVEDSGVFFRRKPDLGGWSLYGCEVDCGHVISLESYSEEELTKIVQNSVNILLNHGVYKKRPKSFRAGAWMAGPKVRSVLLKEGFQVDSSATPPDYIVPAWGKEGPLYKHISKYWKGTTRTSSPYVLLRNEQSQLWEFPDNGSLVDYTSTEVFMKAFKLNVEKYLKNTDQDIYFVTGFHIETAPRYLPSLARSLREAFRYGESLGVEVKFAQFPLIDASLF